MTPLPHAPALRAAHPPKSRSWVPRALLAGLLGLAAAALVACSGSAGKLIPIASSGPLQSDFEAVEQASEAGDGSCTATEAAILKTEQDFNALPSSVDNGLRSNLHQGIANLRSRALALCAQPLVQATVTTPQTTTEQTTPTTTAPTITTPTTPTTPTPTTPTPTTPGSGGGTPAPGAGETSSGGGAGQNDQGGGTGAGEGGAGQGGAGASAGSGAGGEVAK